MLSSFGKKLVNYCEYLVNQNEN